MALITTVTVATVLFAPEAARADQPPPDFGQSRPATPIAADTAPASSQAQATMVAVPGGTFAIGRDDATDDQKPAHTVKLEAFRIDRTEVTNAAFAEYLNHLGLVLDRPFGAGAVAPDGGKDAVLLREGPYGSQIQYPIIALNDENSKIDFDGRRFVASRDYANRPVAETTWAGARAYCEWRGARLPTEAE